MSPGAPRYEILPMGSGPEDALRVTERSVVTVTCSPRHGLDETLDVAERIQAGGHEAVVHLAARAVRDRGHLDAALARIADAGMTDVFVVGGDGSEPAGPYGSAGELLAILAEHPHRPARIGIGAYPEGHPLIDEAELDRALAAKAPQADYLVTQLCFDTAALITWLERIRAEGIATPVYLGVPGIVDRRRLMEISLRVGVGPSLSFLRKQRGLKQLFGRPSHAAADLRAAIAPRLNDSTLNIAGLHYYTFNRMVDTWQWEQDQARSGTNRSVG